MSEPLHVPAGADWREPKASAEDWNERGGNRCHASTLYVTDIFDGEHVVRGAKDGQLYIATFASKQQAELFVQREKDGPWLVYGKRAPGFSPNGEG